MSTPTPSHGTPISVLLPRRAARTRRTPRPDRFRRVVRWVGDGRWWERVGVSVLFVGALFLRAHLLTTLPAGIHGDEAIFGSEGYAVLHGESVGPYSFIAAGQPTGPFYLDAVAVALFGRTAFAVRAVSMLVGALTIPALFFVLRRSFDRTTGYVGAALLAVMNWHLHFSRVGFALALWLCVVVLTAGALVEAVRSRNGRWWAATGVLAGLGVYAYNGHTVFLAVLLLFVATHVAAALVARTLSLPVVARNLAVFIGALGVVAWSMVAFVLREHEHYRAHLSFWSIFTRPEWQSRVGLREQAAFLATRYAQYWEQLTVRPQLDSADATSIIPTLPPAFLVLALSGVVLALVRHRTPLVWFGLAVLALMPLAPVLTVDGLSRRTFASAAFVAMFAALPFAEAIRLTRAWGSTGGWVVGVGLTAIVLCLVGYGSLRAYFGTFADSLQQAYVFTNEITDAARFMATLPEDRYVYFYSDRWSVKYETRQFLAPAVRAEDRSAEYGRLTLDPDPTQGKAVFVFLGKYRPLYEEVRTRYPGGTLLFGSAAGRPTFVAYVLDTRP